MGGFPWCLSSGAGGQRGLAALLQWHVALQHDRRRAHPIDVRVAARVRLPALLELLDPSQQQAARGNDRGIAGAEALEAPVDDRTHTLLDRGVLLAHPEDPGVARGPLVFAVDQVLVIEVADGP